MVQFFRVLRSEQDSAKLRKALESTPFAREEFESSYERSDCPVETARRLLIRSFMGFGHTGVFEKPTGFRANSNRSGTTPVHDWGNWPNQVPLLYDRLQGVVIENRLAVDVMTQHDGPDTLHYVDPPYVLETRGTCAAYRHEMTLEQHRELLNACKSMQGNVMISGYACDDYDFCLAGWFRQERQTFADGARKRTEVLWTNFEPLVQTDMFEVAA